MRSVFCAMLLTALTAACGATSSAPIPFDEPVSESKARTLAVPPLPVAPSAEQGNTPMAANSFVGEVAEMTLIPSYSFFLQGIMKVGESQPTLVLVQTDVPNLCEHMAQGTMPKNATIFATALVQTDGKPIQTQYDYTAPGHHGLDELPRSMAFFRKLDDACDVSPNDTGAQALYGQAILRTLTDDHVSADYAFNFEEDGSISGHVEADRCEAPYFFANPEQFYQPVEPEQCLDL